MFLFIFFGMLYAIIVGLSYLILKHLVLKKYNHTSNFILSSRKVSRLKRFMKTDKRIWFASLVGGVYINFAIFALIIFVSNPSIAYRVIECILFYVVWKYVLNNILDGIIYKINHGEIDL